MVVGGLLVAGGLLGACTADTDPMEQAVALVAPPVLDFGTVPLGLTTTATLAISNPGPVALWVTGIEAEDELVSDRFTFVVPRKSFLVPGERTVGVPVSFSARATTLDPEGYTARLRVVTEVYAPDPPFGAIGLQVLLRGRPMPPGIEVNPSPVDFGRVLAGGTKQIDVEVRNVADVPIHVWGETNEGQIRWVPDDAGAFSISPLPDEDGRLTSTPLAPGDRLRLRAAYTAGPAGTVARAGWYLRNCVDPLCRILVAFEGQSTDTALDCQPPAVDFGRVNPGQVGTRTVTCTNLLSDPLVVDRVDFEGSPTMSVRTRGGTPQTLAGGETADLEVAYAPPDGSLGQSDGGTIRVQATDPAGNPAEAVNIPVNGLSGGPRIEVEPNPLSFGLVAIEVPLERGLVVSNAGFEPLVVREIRLEGPDADAFLVDRTGFTLMPGSIRVLPVVFDPQREGRLRATLVFVSNDDQRPELAVGLDGEAERVRPCQYTLTPPSIDFGTLFVGTQRVETIQLVNTGPFACIINGFEVTADREPAPFMLLEPPASGVRVPPGGRFELQVRYEPTAPGTDVGLAVVRVSDPAGPVAGVPLAGVAEPPIDLGCPPPQSTPAGIPISLTAGTPEGVRYEWRLVSAPTGGNNTPNLWTPDPPLGRTVQLLPFIVGVYVVELTVTTSGGQSLSCRTRITAEGRGLRVTLTWDGPGDVDLHVHNGSEGAAWFDEPEDCFYMNRTPRWVPGPISVGPNPELDFDNTTADGPENTSIDVPELNRQYHIGVHHYARAQGRIARIEVFCGGTSVPDAAFTSRPLQGTSAGNCNNTNDFWRVATVRFDRTGQCQITPIDTYSDAREACTRL